jgi:hypothetical protein
MAETRGFLFVATGQAYVEEAVAAARSVRDTHPDETIALKSDVAPAAGHPFDVTHTIQPSGRPFLDKISGMAATPFDRTVFLDTDLRVMAPCPELFGILDVYEVAAAWAPGYPGITGEPVCDAFFELNTGVLPYRRSATTAEMFRRWAEAYQTMPHYRGLEDQPALRRVLWQLGIPVYVLPSEYNYRAGYPAFFRSRAKVVHGRVRSYRAAANRINEHHGPRCVSPEPRGALYPIVHAVAALRRTARPMLRPVRRTWRRLG